MSPPLRVVTEPPPKHYLLRNLTDADELKKLAAQAVDPTLDIAARCMAAQMLLDGATRAIERLTAVATSAEMAESFIAAHEAQRAKR